MAEQQYLFSVESEALKDGSFRVRPKRLVDGKEISAKKAAALLGFKDLGTVYKLIKAGKIEGWNPESDRGNGKYRIDLGSVIDYKASRKQAARDGF